MILIKDKVGYIKLHDCKLLQDDDGISDAKSQTK